MGEEDSGVGKGDRMRKGDTCDMSKEEAWRTPASGLNARERSQREFGLRAEDQVGVGMGRTGEREFPGAG